MRKTFQQDESATTKLGLLETRKEYEMWTDNKKSAKTPDRSLGDANTKKRPFLIERWEKFSFLCVVCALWHVSVVSFTRDIKEKHAFTQNFEWFCHVNELIANFKQLISYLRQQTGLIGNIFRYQKHSNVDHSYFFLESIETPWFFFIVAFAQGGLLWEIRVP